MARSARLKSSFVSYIRQLWPIVFSSAAILGLIIGITLLIIGEAALDFEIGLELAAIDGLLVIVGLPVLSVLLCILLSPLSFFVYRLLSRWRAGSATPEI